MRETGRLPAAWVVTVYSLPLGWLSLPVVTGEPWAPAGYLAFAGVLAIAGGLPASVAASSLPWGLRVVILTWLVLGAGAWALVLPITLVLGMAGHPLLLTLSLWSVAALVTGLHRIRDLRRTILSASPRTRRHSSFRTQPVEERANR